MAAKTNRYRITLVVESPGAMDEMLVSVGNAINDYTDEQVKRFYFVEVTDENA